MDQLHTANKVCGGCCAISLNTVDTESSVSPISVYLDIYVLILALIIRNSLQKLAHTIYRDYFLALKIEHFDIFNIFAQNIDFGYSFESPRRGGSNEYPPSMFWIKNTQKDITL